MSKPSERTINLLEPLGQPSDAWTSIYNWVLKVGRYMLVSVEVVVLLVFFARFVLDRINNDLTEEINDKVDILADPILRDDEIKYRNLHLLFNDIEKLDSTQPINSSEVATLISSVPNNLTLENFSFNDRKVTMTLTGTSFDVIKNYEFSLRQNPRYSDVNLTVSRSGAGTSVIEVAVSFLISDGENNG